MNLLENVIRDIHLEFLTQYILGVVEIGARGLEVELEACIVCDLRSVEVSDSCGTLAYHVDFGREKTLGTVCGKHAREGDLANLIVGAV
jgi:hypothetical protein